MRNALLLRAEDPLGVFELPGSVSSRLRLTCAAGVWAVEGAPSDGDESATRLMAHRV